jgi:probable F420-dependent oxidoreductase
VPAGVPYPPSAYVLEPLAVMSWVAAATSRVRIGTTVLVLPMRGPVVVAESIATIDQLSGGRVILGAAAGWLEAEFDALGVPYAERGPRTDEAIEMIRRMWTEDHITADFPVHGAHSKNIRAKPQPAGHVPIWIGGHAKVALERAVRVGDGWHGGFLGLEDTRSTVAYLREHRPEPEFIVSMRTRWDPLIDARDDVLVQLDAYRDAGVGTLVASPVAFTAEERSRMLRTLAELS